MITPEERVLYAVVNQAIVDACERPIVKHRGRTDSLENFELSMHARSAINFLFTDASDAYLKWLEIDPDWLRRELLEVMYERRKQPTAAALRGRGGDAGSTVERIDEYARRAFRINYELWKLSPEEPIPMPRDSEGDMRTVKIVKVKNEVKKGSNDATGNTGLSGKNQTRQPAGSMAIRAISAFAASGRIDSSTGRWVNHGDGSVSVGVSEKVASRKTRGAKA